MRDTLRSVIEMALNSADVEAMKTNTIPGYTMWSDYVVEALDRMHRPSTADLAAIEDDIEMAKRSPEMARHVALDHAPELLAEVRRLRTLFQSQGVAQ